MIASRHTVSLGDLVKATGLARPTAHRLAVALAHHRLVARDVQGRFMLGPRLTELASATISDELITVADPILQKLSLEADESTQLYRRQGDWRVCAATAARPTGMHESIPVGTQLSMQAGSAAQVLLAWEDQNRIVEACAMRTSAPPCSRLCAASVGRSPWVSASAVPPRFLLRCVRPAAR